MASVKIKRIIRLLFFSGRRPDLRLGDCSDPQVLYRLDEKGRAGNSQRRALKEKLMNVYDILNDVYHYHSFNIKVNTYETYRSHQILSIFSLINLFTFSQLHQ